MSELNRLCFEVLRLLGESVRPEIACELDAESWRSPNAHRIGAAAVERFAETLRRRGYRVKIRGGGGGDEIHRKLTELADAIAFADFGETCATQTYLYERVSRICERLKPSEGNRAARPDKVLVGRASSSTSFSVTDEDEGSSGASSSSGGGGDGYSFGPQRTRPPDAVHAQIFELFRASAAGAISRPEIAAKVDAIVDALRPRSPARCRNALLRRLSDVNDAVGTLAGGPSIYVTYANFLRFQVDEVHAMLVNDDVLDDDERCVGSQYARLRRRLLDVGRELREGASDAFAKIAGELKRTLEALRKTLGEGLAYLHRNYRLIWECICMSALTLINCVIFGFAVVA